MFNRGSHNCSGKNIHDFSVLEMNTRVFRIFEYVFPDYTYVWIDYDIHATLEWWVMCQIVEKIMFNPRITKIKRNQEF